MDIELIRSKEAKRVTIIGFFINLVLVIFKILAGIFGKSGAIIADGVHSLSDFLTDIVVLIGFKLTEKPEDECHNYGHDKYETLATVIISIVLAIVGLEIFKIGLKNIILVVKGKPLPQPGVIALIAAVVSIILKEALYRYTVNVGKKIDSSALIANAWHHRSDMFSSIGTFIGIGGAIILGQKWVILDPIASVIVSFFIFKVAFEIFMPSINELLESALGEEEKEKIENIIMSYPDVKSFHHLRTRKIGSKAGIEFHILVDENLNIKRAHNIATEIEKDLKRNIKDSAIITIHIEPYEE